MTSVDRLPLAIADRATKCAARAYAITPARILWTSDTGVANAESLLVEGPAQPVRSDRIPPCMMSVSAGEGGSLLLDFGIEINGHVELVTTLPTTEVSRLPKLRLRFGESASEAMNEPGDRNAGNDYAVRDQIVTLPWLGAKTVGPSGFRFLRIDAVDPETPVPLSYVRALLTLQDCDPVGRFECDDGRLNAIWEAGAWTVRLNLQDYLWDGIKRDRLVWIGDLHPMVGVIQAVFGANAAVPKSLDLIRDATPSDMWMHSISSYSLWWILIHERWWLYAGDRDYLARQAPYMEALLTRLMATMSAEGGEQLDGMRFLDWPTWSNKPAIAAGLQALLTLALEAGGRMLLALGRTALARRCAKAASRARRITPDSNGSRSALALQCLAGMRALEVTAPRLASGSEGLTAFLGYYVLEALGRAGGIDGAISLIRGFWGAMLDRGATSFWEEFDIGWLNNSGRIDELTPPGLFDLHGDFGSYGHSGFRKSLCHGWAAGPTAWLSEHVLGVRPLEPGCRKLLVRPQLGSLRWVRGVYPTPQGPVAIRHERRKDGVLISHIDAPPGVAVVETGERTPVL